MDDEKFIRVSAMVVIAIVAIIVLAIGMPAHYASLKAAKLSATIYAEETLDYLAIDGLNNAIAPNGYHYSKERVQKALTALEQAGLFGKHGLMPLIGRNTIEGKFSGGFLSGTSGEVTTAEKLIFSWKTSDGREYVSTLTFKKIVFKEAESGEYPKIQFKFNGENLMNAYHHRDITALDNLNYFLTEKLVAYASVSISQEDKKSGLYLIFK